MIRPWMQFYTRDWLDSKELRRCKPESRAVLADLMCLAHEGDKYGYLVDSVGPLTSEYMAARCSMALPKFRRCLNDLISNTRIQQDEGGFFISRMVRDEDIRKRRAAGGILGGNPSLKVDDEVNLPPNLDTNLKDKGKGYPVSPARARADSDSDSDVSSVGGSPVVPEKQRTDLELLKSVGWTTLSEVTDEVVEAIIDLNGKDFTSRSMAKSSAFMIHCRMIWFEDFFGYYSWNKNDKKAARIEYFKRVHTDELREVIEEAVIAQQAEQMAREPQFRTRAAKWLKEERWKNQPLLLGTEE